MLPCLAICQKKYGGFKAGPQLGISLRLTRQKVKQIFKFTGPRANRLIAHIFLFDCCSHALSAMPLFSLHLLRHCPQTG